MLALCALQASASMHERERAMIGRLWVSLRFASLFWFH